MLESTSFILQTSLMGEVSITIKQLSALAQVTRLEAFKLLMESDPEGIQAGIIAEKLNVAPNSLSAHLNILTNADLVTSRRQGRKIFYRPNIPTVNVMLASLVEDYCHSHPDICAPLAEISAAL